MASAAELPVVLVFSDSICKYIANHIPQSSFQLYLHANRGARVVDVTQDIYRHRTVGFGVPHVLFIHVGTNNLSTCRSLQEVMGEFDQLIEMAKAHFPNSTIVMSSILPRLDSRHLDDRRISVNTELAVLCNTRGIHYCNNGDSIKRSMLAVDCLHLSHRGNVLFADHVYHCLSHFVQVHQVQRDVGLASQQYAHTAADHLS